MNNEEKKDLINDFLVWAQYNRSTQLQYMPQWDTGHYYADQEELINEFLKEEL